MSLVIYATQPVGAIVGIARIDRVEQGKPEALWKRNRAAVGVEKVYFDKYFEGCDTGHAVHLSNYTQIEKVDMESMTGIVPGFRPPQSFRYLSPRVLRKIASHHGPEANGNNVVVEGP
jgi:predicted transcriptional regulator